MKHTDMYLDPNVTDDEMPNGEYRATPRRQYWHHKHLMFGECKNVFNLTPGKTHVISIITNANKSSFNSALTHVIVW